MIIIKLQYLGTAAAEAIPGVFCKCDTCEKSRKLGGRNIRTRSQAIVDDRLLIDLPPDTYMHSVMHNIELSEIQSCIITHAHLDHLYEKELWCRQPGIAVNCSESLTVYAAEQGYDKIKKALLECGMEKTNRVIPKKVVPFVSFEAEGYNIIPLKAWHDHLSSPVIYLIEKDGKSLLYAHDTGFFPEDTVDYLKKSNVKLNFVSFDCTGGMIPDENYGEGGHMNLLGAVKMRDILAQNGNITGKTLCAVNHFSHNGTPIYDEISSAAKREGFVTSYDGMIIQF